jgi:hypothetical protein
LLLQVGRLGGHRILWCQAAAADNSEASKVKAFIEAAAGRAAAPIPFEEIIEVAKVSIEAADFPRTRP